MRVIVVGATGAVGGQILSGLVGHKAIDHVISLSDARSTSEGSEGAQREIEYRRVNLREDLSEHFRFSDAIVYGGWPIGDAETSPLGSHSLEVLTNVCGSMARADVRAFVYGSSAGAYSEAPAGALVAENWPTTGVPWSHQSLRMAQGEDLVKEFAANHQVIRIVVLRPSLIVYPSKTPSGWRERFGKTVLGSIVAGRRVRIVPDLGSHGVEVIHISDLVDAFRLAVTAPVVGEFNLAADPITSDMLADAFHARKIGLDSATVLKFHSYAKRVGLASLDSETLRLGWQLPTLSTLRAHNELGWSVKHPAISVLQEWARSFGSTDEIPQTPRVEKDDALVEPLSEVDYSALYQRSLSYFGQRVHAIRDDQWTDMTECEGWNVWQLVASMAREQYRTALRLRGEREADIDRKLPGDPLGVSRVDGWDLAAERAMSVRVDPQSVDSIVAQVLPDAICDLTRGARYLARAIGFDGATDNELSRYVEERMRLLDAH